MKLPAFYFLQDFLLVFDIPVRDGLQIGGRVGDDAAGEQIVHGLHLHQLAPVGGSANVNVQLQVQPVQSRKIKHQLLLLPVFIGNRHLPQPVIRPHNVKENPHIVLHKLVKRLAY